MADILGVLLIVFIVLTVIALVGHGLWLLAALLIRVVFGLRERRRDERRSCVFCGRLTPKHLDRCDWCGRSLGGPVADELTDLEALQRQLERFRTKGALKDAVVANLLARVSRYRQRLVEPAKRPAPKPEVVQQPPQRRAGVEEIVTVKLVEEPAKAKPQETPTRPQETPAEPSPKYAFKAPPPARAPKPEPEAKPKPEPRPEPKPEPKPRPKPAAKPRPPRKSWGELLAGLMAERNIHRSELIGVLVGGLLMVGSSVALVINLWEKLEQPYLKFFIFVTYLSIVFVAGLYAHHRWKLEATGRGLLAIATLLVPLNFLAMASFWSGGWQWMSLGTELVSLGIFVWLVALSGRVLVPEGRWALAAAVVGNSAATLVLARLLGPESAGPYFVAAALLPVAIFGAAIGGYLLRLSKSKPIDAAVANGLLTLLGTGAFALVVTSGLVVAKKGALLEALPYLAVPAALAATAVLAVGLTIVRGTAKDAAMAAYHVAGTAVVMVAMLAMLAALGLAWPHPLLLVLVGTFHTVTLAAAAFYYRMPVLHAGAMACAGLVYLTGFHVIFGGLPAFSDQQNRGPELIQRTVDAQSGTALAGLFVLFGLVAELLARVGRHRHGAMYAGGCGVVAVLGLMLVTVHGFVFGGDDALRVAILYAVYGVVSLLLVARWRRAELSYLGLGLLTLAPMWALRYAVRDVGSLWAAVLAAEALVLGVTAAVLRRRSAGEPEDPWTADVAALRSGSLTELFRVPLLHVCEMAAPVALALAVSTAWFDRARIAASAWPWLATAAGCLAAVYLLLAWGYRSRERTWAGSMILLAGLVHTLTCKYPGLDQSWLVALLTHSTLAVAAGAALDLWTKRRGDMRLRETVGRVFSEPLGDSALVSSALVLPAIPLAFAGVNWPLTLCLIWLAAVWLALACKNRDPVMMSAHQVMLAAAAVVGTTVWLMKAPGWQSRDVLLPSSLQAYGIMLGLLSLAWLGIRILLREQKAARELLDPPWPAVDWLIRHAVVALQLLLAAGVLLPGLAEELIVLASPSATVQGNLAAACGARAWLLLAVVAATLIVALWQRWREAELIGTLLACATVPCLVAGRFAAEVAVASALRWGLAGCFVISAVTVWQRKRLLGWCRLAGVQVKLGRHGPAIARTTSLITTVAPVLALTMVAALLACAQVAPRDPVADTFFDHVGRTGSYVVPLLLVIVGLVGYAVRERSAGYAFSAGLVTELAVVLGYALSVVTDPGRTFGVPEVVTLLQLATITAAAWAAAWLLVRRWLDIWREAPEAEASRPKAARVLMNVQLAMGAAGNGLLIAGALNTLAVFHPHAQAWTVAAGKPLGWIALVASVAALVYRQIQLGRRPKPELVGLVGMTVLGLMACTIQWQWPVWGYRTLMLGWAAYAMFVVAVTWWVATVRTLPEAQGPPQALIRAAAVWVRIAGILAVLLGLKAAFFHRSNEELLWAAAAIAVASLAAATMALWQRREGWAFSAALGVNLAASLVVWFRHEGDFGQWWLRLVQANVIASSAVAIVWLAVRRRLYQLRELSLGESPLLAAQTVLPVLGNAMLLIVPLAALVWTPAGLPQEMTRLAEVPGWLALLLAAVAAAWYLRQALPGNLLHVLGGLGLGAGVLAACHTANFNGPAGVNAWLEYRTLVTAWAAAAVALLGVGMAGRRLRVVDQGDWANPFPLWTRSTTATGPRVFPGRLIEHWVTAFGAIVLAMTVIYSAADAAGAWWYIRAILAVSVTAGLLAMWQRLPGFVFFSGLMLNVIAVIAWMAWDDPRTLSGLVQANVLALAAGSAIWSLLQWTHREGVPHVLLPEGWTGTVPFSLRENRDSPQERLLPYSYLAARVAVGVLAAVVAVGVLADAMGLPRLNTDVQLLDWIALASTAVAVAICLWDPRSRLALPGLCAIGLLAVGMGLCDRELSPHAFCHAAAVEAAVFLLATTVLGAILPRLSDVWRALRIPDDNQRWPADWFPAIGGAVAGPAAVLSAWISIDTAFDGVKHEALSWLSGRMVGPLAAVILLAAAVLMTRRCREAWRRAWQHAALGLGLLVLAGSGFVWLVPEAAPWLHRSVILMVAAVVMTLVAGLGPVAACKLGRLLPESDDWIAAGRRITPVFGGLAVVMLALVLVQEAWLFDSEHGAPLAWPANVVVIGALAALAAGCIAFAVRPEWDPLGLDENQRQFYVYAAEVLAGLIGLHVWLTMPWLFGRGFVRRFWMLIVMVVAFVGAGLSEFFQRLKMPVLSKPLERTALLLPLAPAVGFWLMPQTGTETWFLGDGSPAAWLLMGMFYAYMAVSRRSLGLSVLAVLTGNVGLWVLWHQRQWGFLDHPQLWLIPLALAVLAAEHLDRRRLSEAQRTALRYIALSMIYVSSTVEFMIIHRVGESILLPLVLILLSVAGVLAGWLLQVRSFLYLGVTFLVVVIVRMIFYAAFEQDQIWIFWTCCILLGAAIIALFAVFEKRRNDVLAAVERFKEWER